ncbi:MAG: 5'/3'-nucleotidase SurE [Prevotella sp.]|nr:5'/3'-nucleotidase SurE [Prevotella sp.]
MGDLTLHKVNGVESGYPEGVDVWVCSGTPVDCVKMAYGVVCQRKPSLVLGGINHGDNASTNAHYSGTIGVAFEGCMKGIPSIALSLCDFDPEANFTPMRPIVEKVIGKVLAEGLPHFTCLNVNVPKVKAYEELKGIRVCRMADGYWRKEVSPQDRTDRQDNKVYMLEGYYQSNEPEAEDTDAWAIRNGYAAITPCTIDITGYGLLKDFTL